jgi:hypothetical protein
METSSKILKYYNKLLLLKIILKTTSDHLRKILFIENLQDIIMQHWNMIWIPMWVSPCEKEVFLRSAPREKLWRLREELDARETGVGEVGGHPYSNCDKTRCNVYLVPGALGGQ